MVKNNEQDRKELKIFDRAVGTFTGWEEVDDFVLAFYDFEPYEGFDMPKSDLTVDYVKGTFKNYDDAGEVTVSKDFFLVLFGFIARQKRL